MKSSRSCVMDTRKITKEYRLSHWAGIMRERAESGLTVKEFCESAGFHENIYYYWQRRLREAASQQLLTASPVRPEGALVPNAVRTPDTPTRQGWAVCSITQATTKEPSIAIEIGRCKVTVTSDFDQDLLAKVCRTMMSIC